jgi:hypothetical protein
MGLLDEAIREHLELKRRRGADAGELSREESEALGPVRRTPDGTPDLASIPEPVAPALPPAGYAADPPAHDAGWEDQTAILPAAAVDPPPAEEQPYEPPPIPAAPDPGYVMPPALPPMGYDEHPPGFEDLDEEPPVEPPATAPRDKPRMRLRLRRHADEAAPAPAEPPRSSFENFDPPTAAHEPPPAAYQAPPAHTPPPPAHQPPPAHDRDAVPADHEPAGEDLLEETPEFLEETPDHDRLWFEQRPPRDFDFDK